MGRDPKNKPRDPVAVNLREARIAAGFESVSEAARFIGIPVPSAVAHEGKGKSFRKPKLDQLRKYAMAYHTTIDALEGGTIIPAQSDTPARDIPPVTNLVSAPILGTAQAGHWLEVDPIANEDMHRVNVAPSKEKLFAVNVTGDSMNRIIQDGDVAVIQPWATRRNPRDNEVLLVQRERNGKYELTIKTHRDGKLYPESTNPKWRHPIAMRDGDTVTIVGIVVGLYRKL